MVTSFNQHTHNGTQQGQQEVIADLKAEQILIALAYTDFDNFKNLKQRGVSEDWFTSKSARALWVAMYELYKPPAMEAYKSGIANDLTKRGVTSTNLEKILAYLDKAVGLDTPNSHLETKFGELLEAYQRRIELTSANKWVKLINDPNVSTATRISEIEKYLSDVKRVATHVEVLEPKSLAIEMRGIYQDKLDGLSTIVKIPYEQECLNVATDGGYGLGEMSVPTAEPGCGKTAFAQADAWFQCVMTHTEEGIEKPLHTGLFFSLEMTRTRWIGRAIHQRSGLNSNLLEKGRFEMSKNMVFGRLSQLEESKLYLVDEAKTDLLSIERAIDFVAHKTGHLEIVWVDYAQLIEVQDAKDETEQVKKISQKLKQLSKMYNCHIHVIARLNTSGKLHQGKSLEYDADNIMVLKFEVPKVLQGQSQADDWSVMAHFTKQRFFEVTAAELKWNRRYVRYTDPSVMLPPFNSFR